MSEGSHYTVHARCPKGLVLALALPGLLFLTAACEDLNTGADRPTSTSIEGSTSSTSPEATSTTQAVGAATGTTTTTTPEAGSGDDSGPGAGDSADSSDSTEVSLFTRMYLLTTTTERTPDHWTFDEDDEGERKTVRLHDVITVELEFARSEEVYGTHWTQSTPPHVAGVGYDETTSFLGRYILKATWEFVATELGTGWLTISWRFRTEPYSDMWQVLLTVTD